MTYADAMERYGIDRPDLRYGLELEDVSDVFRGAEFVVTQDGARRGRPRARASACRAARRCRASRWTSSRRRRRARARWGCCGSSGVNGALEGPAAKFLARGRGRSARARRRRPRAVRRRARTVSRARRWTACGRRWRSDCNSYPADVNAFVWVTDFPMFERDPQTGALAAVHHPFTAPNPDDLDAARRPSPGRRARSAYDLVLNGTELGGGSIRINDPRVQSRIFRAARHRRGDGAGAVRLPARGAARRRAAARRHRVRLRPHHDAARGRDLAARRDRVPQDDRRARAVRGRAERRFRPRTSRSCTSEWSRSKRERRVRSPRSCPPKARTCSRSPA